MEVDRTGVTTGNQGNRPGRNLPRTAHHRQAIADTEMLTSRYGATALLVPGLSRPAVGFTTTDAV